MALKHVILVWLFVLPLVNVAAQSQLVFSSIDSKDGLSDNRIRNITQLSDGRMMVTTEGVTNLYDGTKFTQLHIQKGCIYPLSGYFGFHHSYEDKHYVWIKNYKQLYIYDKITGKYVVSPQNVFSAMGVNENVSDVFIDANGHHWIKTMTDKLFFYNSNKHALHLFQKDISLIDGQREALLDLVVIDEQAYLFYSNGLMVCYSTKNRHMIYKENSLNGPDRQLYNRTLMVVQKDHLLYLLRNNIYGIMQAYDTKSRQWTTVLKTEYWLNTISIDKDHTIWVSCKEGLWKIDQTLINKQLFNTFNLIDGTDVTTEVSTLYTDQQGGFWVGSFNHGLLYYHSDRFKFTNIGKHYFGPTMKDLIVYTFAAYKSDRYLVGTSSGMFLCHSGTHAVTKAPPLIGHLQCYNILPFKDNYVLLTSTGSYRLNKELTTLTLLQTNQAQTNLVYDDRRLLFFTTLNNGGIITINTGEIAPFEPTNNERAAQIRPQKIVLINDHTVAGIDNNTFFLYQIGDGQVSLPLEELEVSTNVAYTDICLDSRGLIWLGTKDGLLMYDVGTNAHKLLHTEDGLINNSIKAVCEDKKKAMWVTTSGGIAQLTVQKELTGYTVRSANFNRLDGVITSEFHEKSIYISPDNVLLCGGVNGMNMIDLKRPWELTRLKQPLFTALTLNGREVKQGINYDGHVILPHQLSQTDTLTLKHNQNFISLSFSALNFVNPTQTYYRYKLSGVDEDWREIASSNGTGIATYTNLSPGTYTFEVYAANNSNVWSEKAAIKTILIKPPFWKTTVAYLIYLFLFLLTAYWLFGYLKRRTQERLSQKNEARLNQLKFHFFTNVSHEFRTPLTLVMTPLESLMKEVKGMPFEPKIESIYRNAQQLLLLVNQLLDFRRLESGGEKLELRYGNLSDFLRQFDNTFGKAAIDRQLAFHLRIPSKDVYIYFDSDKLTKIMNNLLSNAFKFTPNGGIITVELIPETDKATIVVSDNGKGIEAHDLPFIFDRFYQSADSKQGSGIGLHMANEYILLHKGKIQVKSTVGVGTVFTVQLPLQITAEETIDDAKRSEDKALAQTERKEDTKCKVLVVEDNDELRHFLMAELANSFTMYEAKDGLEGWQQATKEMPDLIISDVLMPNMDGLEMCQKLKTNVNTSHIPLILLTARTADEHRMEGYQVGADEYLAKPFNLDMLRIRANNLIENTLKRQKAFSEKIDINPSELTITSLDQQFITKALGLVEKNMANGDYTVQQLSHDLHMDRTVLYKKIQSITGLAPLEFIRSIRLKRAAQLLEKGGLPVAEVALMTGFNTPKYFTKYFREAFGVNPSHYPPHLSSKG